MGCASTTTRRWWDAEHKRRAPIIHGGRYEFSARRHASPCKSGRLHGGSTAMSATFDRTQAFCTRFGLRIPILLAPMAGVAAPALSSAVANAGGMGSCGVLLMKPEEIVAWASE